MHPDILANLRGLEVCPLWLGIYLLYIRNPHKNELLAIFKDENGVTSYQKTKITHNHPETSNEASQSKGNGLFRSNDSKDL